MEINNAENYYKQINHTKILKLIIITCEDQNLEAFQWYYNNIFIKHSIYSFSSGGIFFDCASHKILPKHSIILCSAL